MNKSNTPQTFSFDDLSKLFSLPLADAAANLGVSTSVLKRVSRENGLSRWPYRAVLSGTSIEEIKNDAAKEKAKEFSTRKMSGAMASSAVSSAILPLQNKASSSDDKTSKPQGVAAHPPLQHQGNKSIQAVRMHNLLHTSLATGASASWDEFKFGFPSNGLSTISQKWWGSENVEGCQSNGGIASKTNEEDKPQSELSIEDGSKPGICEDVNNCSQGTGLLIALRKDAVEEGRKALKLGVFRNHGKAKLGKKERMLLLRIFKS